MTWLSFHLSAKNSSEAIFFQSKSMLHLRSVFRKKSCRVSVSMNLFLTFQFVNECGCKLLIEKYRNVVLLIAWRFTAALEPEAAPKNWKLELIYRVTFEIPRGCDICCLFTIKLCFLNGGITLFSFLSKQKQKTRHFLFIWCFAMKATCRNCFVLIWH